MARHPAFAATMLLAVSACAPAGSASPVLSAPATVTGSTPLASVAPSSAPAGVPTLAIREFDVPAGSHPHDVAPAADGGVWYTGQHVGTLGHLDPTSGTIRESRSALARRRMASSSARTALPGSPTEA